MKQEFEQTRNDVVLRVAEEMALAARTAPKGKGLDLLEIVIVSGEDVKKLSDQTIEVGIRENHLGFQRDGANLLNAQAILLLGTRLERVGLKYCGICGYKNCDDNKAHGSICVLNPNDLGLAIGSAVSKAADYRLDNRIMYSIGKVAVEKNWFSPEVKIAYGIPLSASGKNPFFDRVATK